MSPPTKTKAELYKRYPLSSIVIYNGATILHFLLGGVGIIVGYNFSAWAGYLFGGLYFVFSFAEMYLLMPLVVCPNCVYFKMEDSLCISGLNIFSRKIGKEGEQGNFPKRAEGKGTEHSHEGAEFLHLLEGSISINLGDEEHILRVGDSVYFDSSEPHSYAGRSKKPARAIVITTPPRP